MPDYLGQYHYVTEEKYPSSRRARATWQLKGGKARAAPA
jgi:hypothetical protein